MEWSDGQAHAIPIATFDHASLDSEAAHLREELLAARTDAELEQTLSRYLKKKRWEILLDGFKTALAEIAPGPDMEANWWAICYVSGMADTLGRSGPEIAASLGVSKQAFDQRCDRFTQRFGRRIVRLNMRDDEACANMSKRNYRQKAARQ